MTLPNFLIIGAAKCVTTSLATLLDAHPEAAIVRGKEPHFFSYDGNYAQGIEVYQQRYEKCTNERAIGDASTSYSRIRQHPQVIERIKKHLHDPKIIYMVRHPIERIESAYIEQMTEGHNRHIKSINEAIEKLPMMIDSSRYWETYNAYRKAFGEKNIKVVWFEEYAKNRDAAFHGVCAFLDIDASLPPETSKENANTREASKSRIGTSIKIDTKWNRSTLRAVKKTLQKDNARFLAHFKKPPDYWS